MNNTNYKIINKIKNIGYFLANFLPILFDHLLPNINIYIDLCIQLLLYINN